VTHQINLPPPLNVSRLIDEILTRVRTVIPCDNATVALLSQDGKTLQAYSSFGLERPEVRREIPVSEGIMGWVCGRVLSQGGLTCLPKQLRVSLQEQPHTQ
jgi:hypothetical protein